MKNILRTLYPADFVTIIFYLFLSCLNIVFAARIKQWYLLILLNAVIVGIVYGIAKYHAARPENKVRRMIHSFYFVPLIFVTFKELYLMIQPMHGRDYDHLLIAADRFIFGTDPTHILYTISHPVLTEILQIAYFSFYLLPIILYVSLVRAGKFEEGEYSVYSVLYGFLVSYIGYFLLPAIGPRFTLHNFETINTELPGLFLTNILREIVNSGESIPAGTLNPAQVVQRDVFPSGHTMMTAIVMYLAVHFRAKAKGIILVLGTLLIFATVYLRYHYVIDVIAGLTAMVISLYTGKMIYYSYKKNFSPLRAE